MAAGLVISGTLLNVSADNALLLLLGAVVANFSTLQHADASAQP